MNTRDFAVVYIQRVPLTARLTKDCSPIKSQVQRVRESCVRVCEEADAALVLGVQALAPCFHYKGIVDADDVDLTCIFEAGVVDVARDVRFGA